MRFFNVLLHRTCSQQELTTFGIINYQVCEYLSKQLAFTPSFKSLIVASYLFVCHSIISYCGLNLNCVHCVVHHIVGCILYSVHCILCVRHTSQMTNNVIAPRIVQTPINPRYVLMPDAETLIPVPNTNSIEVVSSSLSTIIATI